MQKTHYPIAYTIDNGYTLHLMAHLITLFESAKETTVYDIYVAQYQMTEENKAKIHQHITKYSPASICVFLDVSDEDYYAIPMEEESRFTRDGILRVLLPKLLPNVDKVIYMDVDVIMKQDITELFKLDLTNKAVAAVRSHGAVHAVQRLVLIALEREEETVNLINNLNYVYAGMMLMNLAFWREHHWVEATLSLMESIGKIMKRGGEVIGGGDVFYVDQDCIAYLLTRHRILHGRQAVEYLPECYLLLFDRHYHAKTGKIIEQNLPINKFATFSLVLDGVVRPEVWDLLKPKGVYHYHMESKPWYDPEAPTRELFMPYANAVGLVLPERISLNVESPMPKVRLNVEHPTTKIFLKKNIKKTIKMLLPYGFVRLIQSYKQKGRSSS